MVDLGLDTFGDISTDAEGDRLSDAQTLRDVVDEAVLADEVGVYSIGLGEHHRRDFAITSPEVVLGTIAGRTRSLRLSTAVTVLSSDDPVRLYERFATLQGLSSGRAEVILGRGSFIESFALFGYDLADYEVLFEEKLELFTELLTEQPVTWSGSTRAPLEGVEVYPKTETPITAWVGVGGSPESVVRAARVGLGLMIAIIGGSSARFRPYVDLYHRSLEAYGREPLPIGVHSPGHIAATDEEAWDQAWPAFQIRAEKMGRERGWPPYSRMQFQQDVGPQGAIYAGSPETVAQKIAATVRTLGAARFDLKYDNGGISHDRLMTSIELYGTRVIPRVQELLAE